MLTFKEFIKYQIEYIKTKEYINSLFYSLFVSMLSLSIYSFIYRNNLSLYGFIMTFIIIAMICATIMSIRFFYLISKDVVVKR